MILVVLALLSSTSFGFSSAPQQQLDPKKVYKYDIKLTVNDVSGIGTLVVPRAKKYVVKGETSGKLDLLTITTCHRDISWSPSGNKFEYIYEPSESLESNGACPLFVGGYDKKGQHSWGIVEFEGEQEKLPGLLKCNGYGQTFNGVSLCQSRQSLIQFIEFENPVKTATSGNCTLPVALKEGRRYEFPIVKGHCVYAFMEIEGQKRIHRMTTIGYEGILLRED